MKLQLKLLLTVAFTIGILYVGKTKNFFSVSWKGFSQPEDIVSSTSSTEKAAASEYSTFSPEIEYKVSVKSAVAENDNDPLIECYSDQKCGGDTVTVKESECTQQKCCEYSPGKWKNMSESECSQSQIASYGQLHSNQDESVILQNPSPTSQQMTPTESPNLAARCASEKAVTISRVKGGLLKKIKSMETPDFHPEDIYVKQVYLNSIKAIYDNAVRKAEQLGTELEHYCLNHNGSIEDFQMPLYYE